jgi:Na+-transporting methylmalonyl-CoA/oxaloacetate decarboxylase gamma subunit
LRKDPLAPEHGDARERAPLAVVAIAIAHHSRRPVYWGRRG